MEINSDLFSIQLLIVCLRFQVRTFFRIGALNLKPLATRKIDNLQRADVCNAHSNLDVSENSGTPK